MASLNVQTPDGKSLTVQIPDGTDQSQYGKLADDALSHYSSTVNPSPAPSEGTIGSFLRGIGNQLPLGNQFAALVSPGSYSKNMADINAATERDKAQNKIAYGGGAVTGTIAPAMIPGVGEAMAANPVAANAAYGAANAISNTDLAQHPVQGAVQAALGGVTGAGLGAATSAILPKASTLESQANRLANKSINMPEGVLVDMTPEEQQAQGAFLRNQGLVGKNKGAILSKAQDLMQGYGEKIGEIGQQAEKAGLTVDDPGMLTQPLMDKASRFESILDDPEADKLYKSYVAGAKAINGLGENPSWSQIQNLKQDYGTLAFKSTGEIKNQAAADTYFTLSNALKGMAEKAQDNPNVPDTYKLALAGYSRMSPVVTGLEKTVDADLRGASGGAGSGFHPMRMLATMPAPVRAVGGTIAALTGHPLLSVAAALPEVMNPANQANAAGALAKAMPMIQNLAQRSAVNAGASQINRIGNDPKAKAQLQAILQRLLANRQAGGQ